MINRLKKKKRYEILPFFSEFVSYLTLGLLLYLNNFVYFATVLRKTRLEIMYARFFSTLLSNKILSVVQ